MYNLKLFSVKFCVNIFILVFSFTLFYYAFLKNNNRYEFNKTNAIKSLPQYINITDDFNVWIIFTKVSDNSPLKYKFYNLIVNILNVSSVPIKFSVVVDDSSKAIALTILSDIKAVTNKTVESKFYNFTQCASLIENIVTVMTPHFSSKPGTYYSDALFYLSLGLHQIAPTTQKRAILLDCDLYFKDDIALLFKEFETFEATTLFGLAPELNPVYRHVLHVYRSIRKTTFGEYYHPDVVSSEQAHPKGFQGYNSGIILLNLSAIRNSTEYKHLITKTNVDSLTKKYNFKGHLGDQDFYTLIGYECPHLIRTLNCGFNRQLCTWWRDHGGYNDVFDNYFKCNHKTIILHGNCNTPIPKS